MQGQWSLKELYTSYESLEYKRDFDRLKEIYLNLSELELKDDLDTIKKVISLLEEQYELIEKLYNFSSLQLTTDTTHEQSLRESAALTRLFAENAKTTAKIERYLGEVSVDTSNDEKLKEYGFIFKEYKDSAKHLLSDEVEEVISTMNMSAGSSWEMLQSFLTSTVDIDFDGEVRTLSDIRNLAHSQDADVRKRAYEAELAMYEKIKEPVAFSINNIKSQVNDISRLRGFESAIDETLLKSRMKRETLDALIASIEESLPIFRKYLKHKAKLLGHKNGLPFYDLFAPVGQSASKKFTVEESRDYLVKHFSEFSMDLSDLTKQIYDENHVDMFPRKGKVGGAFCSNLTAVKQSRILMNFDGNLRNVVTMAHELGHAYHGLHIQDHLPLNRSYSMPVAETASTFNENLIMNKVILESSDEEKIGLIESSLQDTTQILVDIYSRYLFESELFERRKGEFLFSADLEKMMLDAQEKSYADGLDPEFRHPFMWLNKGHYYSTSLSFYNFPYAFGGLFSKGLYEMYKNKPEGFVEKYQEMLKFTTISTVEETAQKMGIDVTKKDFWRGAIAGYEQEVEEFIRLTSK